MLIIVIIVAIVLPVINCAKLADIHWNSSNPIFRIDNTDHIIDVNRNAHQFDYDQVDIVCPQAQSWSQSSGNNSTAGASDSGNERLIIYNVSKDEYDMCTINSNARTIAVCDPNLNSMIGQQQNNNGNNNGNSPNLNSNSNSNSNSSAQLKSRSSYITVTFRSFSPQPNGLEFRPGQDYYFISAYANGPPERRFAPCQQHNMKVIFKVCCKATTNQVAPLSSGVSSTSLTSANAGPKLMLDALASASKMSTQIHDESNKQSTTGVVTATVVTSPSSSSSSSSLSINSNAINSAPTVVAPPGVASQQSRHHSRDDSTLGNVDTPIGLNADTVNGISGLAPARNSVSKVVTLRPTYQPRVGQMLPTVGANQRHHRVVTNNNQHQNHHNFVPISSSITNSATAPLSSIGLLSSSTQPQLPLTGVTVLPLEVLQSNDTPSASSVSPSSLTSSSSSSSSRNRLNSGSNSQSSSLSSSIGRGIPTRPNERGRYSPTPLPAHLMPSSGQQHSSSPSPINSMPISMSQFGRGRDGYQINNQQQQQQQFATNSNNWPINAPYSQYNSQVNSLPNYSQQTQQSVATNQQTLNGGSAWQAPMPPVPRPSPPRPHLYNGREQARIPTWFIAPPSDPRYTNEGLINGVPSSGASVTTTTTTITTITMITIIALMQICSWMSLTNTVRQSHCT